MGADRRRPRLVLAVAVALLAAGVGGGIALARAGEPPQEGESWSHYRDQQRRLTLLTTVRRCDEITRAQVRESPTRVEVSLHVDRGGPWCADLAVEKSFSVTLREALGGRAVYDAACLDDGGDRGECRRTARG